MIERICDAGIKRDISREVLKALEDWFGIASAREEYISHSAEQVFFADREGADVCGFLCLKETGRDTVELAVMGVKREFHRQGVGHALFCAAKTYATEAGYSFMQVKTVQMGRYEEYDCTNRFYLSLGFKEFEVFPTLWDKWNPCQVYVLSIR